MRHSLGSLQKYWGQCSCPGPQNPWGECPRPQRLHSTVALAGLPVSCHVAGYSHGGSYLLRLLRLDHHCLRRDTGDPRDGGGLHPVKAMQTITSNSCAMRAESYFSVGALWAGPRRRRSPVQAQGFTWHPCPHSWHPLGTFLAHPPPASQCSPYMWSSLGMNSSSCSLVCGFSSLDPTSSSPRTKNWLSPGIARAGSKVARSPPSQALGSGS